KRLVLLYLLLKLVKLFDKRSTLSSHNNWIDSRLHEIEFFELSDSGAKFLRPLLCDCVLAISCDHGLLLVVGNWTPRIPFLCPVSLSVWKNSKKVCPGPPSNVEMNISPPNFCF